MKAMVLSAPNELALGEVARPAIGEGQVLVRVTYSGICGTDYKIYSGAIPVRYPRIMGHEMIGEVVEAGPDANVRRGDRAIIDPELYCGACFHCRIGQTHLCPNGMLLGRDANGGFAEYVTAPASHVFPLPESIDNQTAPLIQVLKVREATDGRGADVVIECTGMLPVLSDAIHMARSGGRLLLFGIITAKQGELPFYDLYFKELALINARVAKSEDYPNSIALVQRGTVRLEPLVSHVMPLGQLKDAIGMLGSDNGQRMKIILEHA
jgi:threonine dehydrogenase-like Zn-dependent dehydrogenase